MILLLHEDFVLPSFFPILFYQDNNYCNNFFTQFLFIQVLTIAGGAQGFVDGAALSGALFAYPTALVIESVSGNVYILDQWGNAIRRLNWSTKMVTTIAGGASAGVVNGTFVWEYHRYMV